MSNTKIELINERKKDLLEAWALEVKISVGNPSLTKAQYAKKLMELAVKTDSFSIDLMLKGLAELVENC